MIGTFPLSAPVISNIKIVSILILEHASLYYASPSKPNLDDALDGAYSQYIASNTHYTIMQQFSAPFKAYPILQFTEFILTYCL
jgi:hypothetical protein